MAVLTAVSTICNKTTNNLQGFNQFPLSEELEGVPGLTSVLELHPTSQVFPVEASAGPQGVPGHV